MQKLVKEYLNELNRRQRKRRKVGVAVMLLVVLVASTVVGALTRYGVAMTEEAKCGIAEHQHTESCYQDAMICNQEETEGHQHTEACYQVENVLICGQEEREGHQHGEGCYQPDDSLSCTLEETEGHQHGDGCYQSQSTLTCGQEEREAHQHTEACHETQLACGMEEHTHTETCRIDTAADVEDASRWDAQYANVTWTDNWGEDLVTAAQKQLGYKESMNNYQIAEDGSHKGYTRYGQYMGDVYADWDAAFVNFCLHYAKVANSGMFPNEMDSAKWHERLANGANGMYLTAKDGYEPQAGDIVFFNRNGEETGTQMGIVSSYDNGSNQIKVIEGNSANEVKENKYAVNDSHIFAYLKVTEMEHAYKNIGDAEMENPDAAGEGNAQDGIEGDGNAEAGAGNASDADNTDVENVGDAENGTEDGTNAEGSENGTEDDASVEGSENDTENDAGTGDENGEIPADVMEMLNTSPAYEASYEDEMGTIHVAAGEGVVPEGAELSVTKIEPIAVTASMTEEETEVAKKVAEQYELTSKKLLEESEKRNETLEGFLAYDICFIVDGEEVEPNGPVKVTMDFKEAVKPEGVSENATVAVNHLKEDETAEDGVVVEDLTEKAATTITTGEEETAVEKVELVTERFSTFTISWMLGGSPFGKIGVECVNQIGGEIGNDVFGFSDPMEITLPTSKENLQDLLGIKAVEKSGVTYVPIEIRIREQQENVGDVINAVYYDNSVFEYVFYLDNVEVVRSNPGDLENYILRIVYEASELEAPIDGLVIDDKIQEEGTLKAVFDKEQLRDETLKTQYELAEAEGKTISYVWSKSINGGDFVPVGRDQYDNGQYNVAESGEWLNVALDGGALNATQTSVSYRVEMQIDGEAFVRSMAFSIQYYDYVRNGSFENPQYDKLVNQPSDASGVDEYKVEGWYSTAEGRIEIVKSNNGTIDGDYGYKGRLVYAADGNQFAELNCEAEGSLYQDVLVIKGTPLYYSFAHRGRANSGSFGDDKMSLVIMPTVIAEGGINSDACQCGGTHTGSIDTQQELRCLRDTLNAGGGTSPYYPGAMIKECVANTDGWTRHTGEYVPEYNLTRFFFISNEQEMPKQGNFLDDISFSQYLPRPTEGTFNFRVEKVVRGLEATDAEELKAMIKNLQFEISIDDGKETLGEIPKTLSALDLNWSYNSATESWIGVKDYPNITIGDDFHTISITEKNENVNSYTCVTKVTELSSSATMTLDSEESESNGNTAQGTSTKEGSVVVSKNTSKGLRFLNTYNSQEVTYDWKVVKHSSSGKEVYVPGATFNLTNTDGSEKLIGTSDANGIVKWDAEDKVKSLNGTYILSEESVPAGYVKTLEELTVIFKDGKLQSIPNGDGLSHIEIVSTQNECTILVRNDVEAYELPSTGGAGIYLYMCSGVLLMAGAALITYRNKRKEVLRS